MASRRILRVMDVQIRPRDISVMPLICRRSIGSLSPAPTVRPRMWLLFTGRS
jgi:hypothetical protein